MLPLDHLVYATPDLDATLADLERRLGLRAGPGGRHPRWSTRNALYALGPTSYLEVIGPDPSAPPPPEEPPFGLATLAAPRLVTWCARSADLAADCRAAGIAEDTIRAGGRVRADGARLEWRLSDTRLRGDGLWPFLVQWESPEHPATSAVRGLELLELRAEHPRVAEVRAGLDRYPVELELTRADEAALCAALRTPAGRVELR